MFISLLVLAIPASLIYIAFFRIWFPRAPFRYSQVEVNRINGVDCLVYHHMPYYTHFENSSRARVSLNQGWTVSLHDGTVDLPHCFNTADSQYRDYAGDVVYEKRFGLAEFTHEQDCQYHLVFEGSFLKTSVYINDRLIGKNIDGYLPFRFDITKYMKDQPYLDIKVVVNNDTETGLIPPRLFANHALGFHGFGGMHKDVYIEKCPAIHCFKCHVSANPKVEKGNVELKLGFYNASGSIAVMDLKIDIFDNEKRLVYSGALKRQIDPSMDIQAYIETLHIDNPRLWSHEDPHLYSLEITTPYETFSVKFGFRAVGINDNRITVNGRKVFLKGICKHEVDLENGLAESAVSMDRDMELIQQLNANYVRLAHYPHSPHFLDRCDREGIMAWCEIPLYQAGLAPVQYISSKKEEGRDSAIVKVLKLPLMIWKTRQMTDTHIVSRARDSLLLMMERDYNHPSILFWGIGNECWTMNPAGAKALRLLKKVVDDHDGSRIAGYAAITIPFVSSLFERSFKEMDVLGTNEYFGWYYGKASDVSRYIRAVCKKNKKPLLITETGADCRYGEHTGSSAIERGVSEEYQVMYFQNQFAHLREHDQFAGISPWILRDFLCPEYGAENPVPFYNIKGLVDKHYNKKKAFYTVQKIYEGEMGDNGKEN
mgnify:CR=1 FL=1